MWANVQLCIAQFAARLRERQIRFNMTINFRLCCYLITANKLNILNKSKQDFMQVDF